VPGRLGVTARVAASPETPLIHPVFKLLDWNYRPVRILANGTPMATEDWRGSWVGGDLVVWIRPEFSAPVEFRLESY
jgi:hypothetical protein